MKIVIFVLSTVILMAVSAGASNLKHDVEITGYKSGQWSPTDEIEQTISQKIVIPISETLKLKSGARVEIIVRGFADKTGTQNDQLAEQRAEQVAGLLSEKFPQAKIVSISKGDEQNIRMVAVDWSILPTVQQNPGKSNQLTPWIILGLLVGITALTAIFFLLRSIRRQAKNIQREVAQPKLIALPVAPPLNRWIEVKTERFGRLSLRITQKNTAKGIGWETPFFAKSNPTARMLHGSMSIAARSIKNCVKSTYYADQIPDLITAGLITETNQGEGTCEQIAS